VLSHDRKFHTILPECSAIKQHNIACFYLWGASEPIWPKLHCFMGASSMHRAATQQRPFIYEVTASCQFRHIAIP
jgi:hypothetical protein